MDKFLFGKNRAWVAIRRDRQGALKQEDGCARLLLLCWGACLPGAAAAILARSVSHSAEP